MEHAVRAVAEQAGREIDQQFVDQALCEQRAVQPEAGFDVDLVQFAARELA